jgi:phosphoribosyl 1,2-cyclic phosphodiesterase
MLMNTFTFLGTGAADWNIAHRDGFFRRNSSALLDGKILFDAGAHVFDYLACESCPDLLDGVTLVLITHDHEDHVDLDTLRRLAEHHPFALGADEELLERLGHVEGITPLRLPLYEESALMGYKITPVLANHDVVLSGKRRAVHYIIETPEGKTLFYGLDGAWLLRPTWQEMKKHRFDLMVFDCTVGDSDDWRLFEHNTIPMLRKITDEILRLKMLNEGGKLVASHLARTLHLDHETTTSILADLSMLTAYDGLSLVL